jgi:FlaA1/EpsC-like NDP-sugar epimerase
VNNVDFKNEIIVLTGAVGTVGSEILKVLLETGAQEIRLLDNNETELFTVGEKYADTGRVTPFLGDVRDLMKLDNIIKGAHMVFHTAAFKHVYLSEYNPFDTVQTNILGVQNVIQAALRNKVKKVIFTSSDKAVNPTNVMGTTKLMGERLITAANIVNSGETCVLASSRFGNVIGSRGSVVPIFVEQIKKGGPVTVTDDRMTRFIMSIRQSAQLLIEAIRLAKGGEVFITKMPTVRIIDIAETMIEALAPHYGFDPQKIDITIIGAKPGEKLYEELMSEEESTRSVELTNMFVTLPAFRAIYKRIDYVYPGLQSEEVIKPYTSANQPYMTKEEIKKFLGDSGIISTE